MNIAEEAMVTGAYFWLSVWAVFGSIISHNFLNSRILAFWTGALVSGFVSALFARSYYMGYDFGLIVGVCFVASLPVNFVISVAFYVYDYFYPRKRYSRYALVYLLVIIFGGIMTIASARLYFGANPTDNQWLASSWPFWFAFSGGLLALFWALHRRYAY